MCFLLARYKLIAKMLAGKTNVLEVAVATLLGLRLPCRPLGLSTALISSHASLMTRPSDIGRWTLISDIATFAGYDVRANPIPGRFEEVFSLDAIEHVPA